MSKSSRRKSRCVPFTIVCSLVVAGFGCAPRVNLDRMPIEPWQKAELQTLLADLEGDHLLSLEIHPVHGVFVVMDHWSDGKRAICDVYSWDWACPQNRDQLVSQQMNAVERVYTVESRDAVEMYAQLYSAAAELLGGRQSPVSAAVKARDPDRRDLKFLCLIVIGSRDAWGETIGEYTLSTFLEQSELWYDEFDEEGGPTGGSIAEVLLRHMLLDEVAARPEILVHYLLDHFDVVMSVAETAAPADSNGSQDNLPPTHVAPAS